MIINNHNLLYIILDYARKNAETIVREAIKVHDQQLLEYYHKDGMILACWDGYCPADLAVQAKNLQALEYFLKRGQIVHGCSYQCGHYSLTASLRVDDISFIKMILDYKVSQPTYMEFCYALLYAKEINSLKHINVLLTYYHSYDKYNAVIEKLSNEYDIKTHIKVQNIIRNTPRYLCCKIFGLQKEISKQYKLLSRKLFEQIIC